MDINRIITIQNSNQSNEAQEIVNSRLQQEIDDINKAVVGKQGSKVYIGNTTNPITNLIFNSEKPLTGTTTITTINCGTSTSEDMRGN